MKNSFKVKKLLIAADCKVDGGFIAALEKKVGLKADLLYIPSGGRKRVKKLYRHISYFATAIKSFKYRNEYRYIVFWQQFIGFYYGLVARLSHKRDGPVTLLFPLIYKERSGVVGRVYKWLFHFFLSLDMPSYTLCLSSKERIYYLNKFGEKYSGKICFVKYGMGTPESSQKVDHITNNKNRFFFSGGTSNRDYQILVKTFKGLEERLKIACFPRDIKGLDIPPNVEVLHNVFGADFEDCMRKAYAVIISLDDPNISAGVLVLLNAMRLGKPIIATRSAGIEDYISEDCAILIDLHSSDDIRQAVKRSIAHKDYLFQIGYKAIQSYKDSFTIEKFGKRIGAVLHSKHKVGYCDLCSSNTFLDTVLSNVSDNEKIINKKFQIVSCVECENLFLWPFPKDIAEIEGFYPQSYYAHHPIGTPRSIKYNLKKLLKDQYYKKKHQNYISRILFFFLGRKINEPPFIKNGDLCDIGCGNGAYILEARSYGWSVYGVEPNENAVNHCLSKGFNVKQGWAEKIPYDNSCFDVVRMWNVLEHTISPKKALSEAYRVLKKNGYLLVYVPNFNSIDRRTFGSYWGNLEIPRHLYHFTHRTIELYLERTGFSIEKSLYPGLIVSGLKKTVNVMLENKVGIVSIFMKIVKVVFVKLIYRICKGSYAFDAGIVMLVKKKCSESGRK